MKAQPGCGHGQTHLRSAGPQLSPAGFTELATLEAQALRHPREEPLVSGLMGARVLPAGACSSGSRRLMSFTLVIVGDAERWPEGAAMLLTQERFSSTSHEVARACHPLTEGPQVRGSGVTCLVPFVIEGTTYLLGGHNMAVPTGCREQNRGAALPRNEWAQGAVHPLARRGHSGAQHGPAVTLRHPGPVTGAFREVVPVSCPLSGVPSLMTAYPSWSRTQRTGPRAERAHTAASTVFHAA